MNMASVDDMHTVCMWIDGTGECGPGDEADVDRRVRTIVSQSRESGPQLPPAERGAREALLHQRLPALAARKGLAGLVAVARGSQGGPLQSLRGLGR